VSTNIRSGSKGRRAAIAAPPSMMSSVLKMKADSGAVK